MPNPQHAILTNLTKYQWYTHFSRTDGADLGVIKQALADVRAAGAEVGLVEPINVCILFGPTLLADLTDDIPNDFQPYPGYESPDGKVAKATQEELLLWLHSEDKDLCWETQYNFRTAVKDHMTVARETPTFIYRNSLDLTGFIDGTGNPAPEDQFDRAIVPEGNRGRRLVLHRAALGPRPRVLQRALARGPGEHVRPVKGRLHPAPGAGAHIAPESRRATRWQDRRREHTEAG
jgi:putative iron-dependent peroxidase